MLALLILLVVGALALAGPVPQTVSLVKRFPDLSPKYPLMFQVPLPIPPVKQPKMIITNPNTTKPIWYYEMEIKPFQQQIYPNLPSAASLVGYDGMSPGPTFIVPRGVETVVRFINNSSAPNSVHLHGSYSRAPFDGWAEDTTQPGQFKDYYYPNRQSGRMMWYHDHAVHSTAENAYRGQAGVYLVDDPVEDAAVNLPSGYAKFDIPLVLSAKQYQGDGSLFSTVGETISLWGDVVHVNGQPWPFLAVQPRKYRFRFLNAAVSRTFSLYFVDVADVNYKLRFQVVGSDSGLLERPVWTSSMDISMAERYDVVFDFSPFAGRTIELRNFAKAGGAGVEDDYENTDKVMRFVVSRFGTPDNSTVPSTLRKVPWPSSWNQTRPRTRPRIDHHFKFHRANGTWLINGVAFADAANRVLARVPRGTVEIWELENTSDGWGHQIHVHLVDFRVLSRWHGTRAVAGYERAGLKDVVWLGREEKVLVEAHYAPWDGVYMFHCHNLVHEDDDMMAAFNVTVLPHFGYEQPEFLDPMDARWRPRPFVESEYAGRTGVFSDFEIQQRILEMASARPYQDVDEITSELHGYWTNRTVVG